jgi:hypothetical protein
MTCRMERADPSSVKDKRNREYDVITWEAAEQVARESVMEHD